jgi:SAM-dependent methyltransferase
MDAKEFFTLVHKHNAWGSPESKSGAGSTLSATRHIRRELPRLLKRFSIGSILDLPCGDMNWMSTLELSGIRYIGADIVTEIVQENRAKYPEREFEVLDLLTSDLPRVDLVLVRDCFIHFPQALTLQALRNIARSKSIFLLTTHYQWHESANIDIPLGKYTRVNFQASPYSFPNPRAIIPEGNSESDPYLGSQADRCLALWAISDLRV